MKEVMNTEKKNRKRITERKREWIKINKKKKREEN